MAWIDQLRLAERKNALDHWLRSCGPSDPQKSPQELAVEFCEYEPKWRGDEHRKSLEMEIGMYQRAEAERSRRKSAALNAAPYVQPARVIAAPSAEANGLKVRLAEIAEYLFSQHPKDGTTPMKKEALRKRAAEEGPVPDMSFDEFDNAFQRVYETERGRPPKEGWALRARYQRRSDPIRKRTRQ